MIASAGRKSFARCGLRLAVLLLVALASSKSAERSDAATAPPVGPAHLFEGIIGEDDRMVLDAGDPPFSAIGRLNVSGFSALRQCTGFLVAPDVVVTAAHCVFNGYSGETLAPGRFHFLPGWQRQKYLAHGIGKCVRVMQGFTPNRNPTAEQMSFDVAVIILRKKLDIEPIEAASSDAVQAKTALVHAGYSRDKRHLLTGDADCRVLEERERIILTDCDTNRGASGGPVLMLGDGGRFEATAVMVGGFARQANVAVKLSAIRDFIKDATCGP